MQHTLTQFLASNPKMINRKDSEFLHYLVGPGLALISAPILANGLGASGRGIYSSIVNLCLFMAITLGFGLDLLLASEQEKKYEISIVVEIIRKYSFFLLILPIILTFWIINFLYGESFNYAETLVISMTVPLLIATNLVASYARHVRNLKILGLIQSNAAIVRTLLIFALFAIGFLNIASAIIFTFLANITSLLALFKFDYRLRDLRKLSLKNYHGPEITRGLRVLPATIFTIATYRLDQILGIFIIGNIQLGIYAVAVSICEIPILLIRSYKDGLYKIDEENASRIIRTAIYRMTALLILIAIALPIFFTFILSSEYGSGVIVGELMLVVVFVQALFELNSMYLIRKGQFNRIIFLQGLYLVITFTFAIFFRHLGALALVIGNLLGYTVALAILLAYKKRG